LLVSFLQIVCNQLYTGGFALLQQGLYLPDGWGFGTIHYLK